MSQPARTDIEDCGFREMAARRQRLLAKASPAERPDGRPGGGA